MTKKDYILIAEVLNDIIFTSTDNNQRMTNGHIDNLVDAFSIRLKRENPRFDRTRFIDACFKTTQS